MTVIGKQGFGGMSKKRESDSKATFEVRFIAPGLHPDKIPLRQVSEALTAVQDLAVGRDPFEMPKVPDDKGIGLVRVRSGSAIYSCVSPVPSEAIENLSRVGALLSLLESDGNADLDYLATALSPIKTLSDVARLVDCRLEVRVGENRRKPLVVIGGTDYERISQRLLLQGETSIAGKLERVGGATETKCMLRLPGRRRSLYCDVKGRDLARKLGQHLYENILASGTAIWIHRTWRILHFTVKDFSQPELGDPKDAIKRLRAAGLKAWDDVEDPDALISEFRS